MQRAFTLSSLVMAGVLAASVALAQSDPFAAADTEEQMQIDVRYVEERLYEVSTYGSAVVSSDYETLLLEVSDLFVRYPQSAEVWAISGLVKYYYYLDVEDERALAIAEGAKNDLETAIAMDAGVMGGDPYMYLGNLYLTTPPWPSGFGDESRAGELLWRAATLDPEGLDSNYFLARYLLRVGEIEDARVHLEIALDTSIKDGSERRRAEIEQMLDEL